MLRSVIGVWVCRWQTIHYEKESESVNITPLPLLVLELRNREQVSLPICLAQHSHILHLTSQSSDIVSLSQRLTQPVNQAAAFFWRFFSLCGISASHDDTSKWSCAGSKPTASSAWELFLQTFIRPGWSNSNTLVFIVMTWGRSGWVMGHAVHAFCAQELSYRKTAELLAHFMVPGVKKLY